MNNIYLVSRTDTVDWCQDFAMVVVACDKMWAEKIARQNSRDFKTAKLKVDQIDLEKEGTILKANSGA